jgi:predicted dehydrogenase
VTAAAPSPPAAPAEKPVRLALIGTGSRGMTYGREGVLSGLAVVTAVAEPRALRREQAAAEFGVAADRAVAGWPELLGRPDLDVDAVVVATPDREHLGPALATIGRGLPLLLEKPMAPTEEHARQIVAAAEQAGVLVCVAHVLRYSAYTQAVTGLIDAGAIGDVVSIEHLEPVGWWHQAHSFVRGNWRREDQSSPMLLAKCCHDIDWLSAVVGRPALRVSSFGSLSHFTPANKPAGAASRCLDCAVEPECPYSAKRIYLDHVDEPSAQRWPLSILTEDLTREGVTRALREGPYGRCVYECDNDVVDHQVVNIEYAGGVTASLTMTAFTPMSFRKTRIFGTRGTLEGDGYTVSVFDFLTGRTSTQQVVDAADPEAGEGHLGADGALTRTFLTAVSTRQPGLVLTSPAESLATHAIVWAAERARHLGRVETLTPTPEPLNAP